jgi:hypothetical protein
MVGGHQQRRVCSGGGSGKDANGLAPLLQEEKEERRCSPRREVGMSPEVKSFLLRCTLGRVKDRRMKLPFDVQCGVSTFGTSGINFCMHVWNPP